MGSRAAHWTTPAPNATMLELGSGHVVKSSGERFSRKLSKRSTKAVGSTVTVSCK